MLGWAIFFFIIAIIAAVFGFGGIASTAAGIATGASVRAAIQGISHLAPQEIHLCVPVAAKAVLESLSTVVDQIHCPNRPEPFHAVGLWYKHFDQVDDEEVIRLLSKTQKSSSKNSVGS